MKRIVLPILILLFLLAGLFLLIQLIPVGTVQTNPPVLAEPPWDSSQTRATFMRVCGDCHSNETVWPWYSRVAPVSWLVARDVREGRQRLNVSEWGLRHNESDEIVEVVRKDEMPPRFYLPMHPEARLSAAEKQVFLQGLAATFGGEEGSATFEDEED